MRNEIWNGEKKASYSLEWLSVHAHTHAHPHTHMYLTLLMHLSLMCNNCCWASCMCRRFWRMSPLPNMAFCKEKVKPCILKYSMTTHTQTGTHKHAHTSMHTHIHKHTHTHTHKCTHTGWCGCNLMSFSKCKKRCGERRPEERQVHAAAILPWKTEKNRLSTLSCYSKLRDAVTGSIRNEH